MSFDVNTFKITDDVVRTWSEIYILSKDGDKHARFGEALGISRDEAKAACFKVTYVVPFLKFMNDLGRLSAYEVIRDKAKEKEEIEDLVEWIDGMVNRTEDTFFKSRDKAKL